MSGLDSWLRDQDPKLSNVGEPAFSISAHVIDGREVVTLAVGGIRFHKVVDSELDSVALCMTVQGFLERLGIEFE